MLAGAKRAKAEKSFDGASKKTKVGDADTLGLSRLGIARKIGNLGAQKQQGKGMMNSMAMTGSGASRLQSSKGGPTLPFKQPMDANQSWMPQYRDGLALPVLLKLPGGVHHPESVNHNDMKPYIDTMKNNFK